MNKIFKTDSKNISCAARIIRQGGLVAFPTETVYGLGANGLDPEAVIRIFETKQRPKFDPLILHIADISQLNFLCREINLQALKLIKKFWPGPLTIILKKNKIVPDIVTAGMETVAVRMPAHSSALQLIKKSGCPIAAPSANKFSYITPTTARIVSDQIGDKVDMILDGGRSAIGIESTIISLTDKPVILRPGKITKDEIEKIIGPVKSKRSLKKVESPGQFKKHYAPHTKMRFIGKTVKFQKNKNIGLIAFKKPVQNKDNFKIIKVLSPGGDLHEAAKNLFSTLYMFDHLKLDMIYVEKVPEKGIGIAIMDRLKKAVN